jgi:pilus assembly protein FimV
MAIFGFNKAKVLASAEKAVQQGKLQNAITEYEKIVKEDPKDLTVLNTIGDLYSRVGNAEQAVHYFKKVGEAYATEGFTVKAIAMYKKLTKAVAGNLDGMKRLAELYTIQGLYNDARSQYVAVADAFLKQGNNDDAAGIFAKVLELDPDNTAMQQKLADLYLKLGKKNEARNIYFTAAQSLYVKQAMDQADEALGHVLFIDPKNMDALLLRGTIAAESGNGSAALGYLKEIPDIDSRPEGLRSLLRAQLQLKNFTEAGPIATKLLTVHNDLSGVGWYADGLINEGKLAEGIQVYEQNAEKLLAANSQGLMKTLTAVITRVKDSSAALEPLRKIFSMAGDTTHDNEIMELLAHAYVQDGALVKAKDLYQTLSENEPENPLHAQNYKQVIAKLGEDVAAAPLTAEQGAQAIMLDEVEKPAAIHIDYPADVAAAVHSALTDSELFDSYNLPAKAVAPLEVGLKKAPRDPQINQRLANLYAKMQRYSDAARCCDVLKHIYGEHGLAAEAQKYGEMAGKYLSMSPDSGPGPVMEVSPVMEVEAVASEVPAFSASSIEMPVDVPPAEAPAISMEVSVPAPEASASHEVNLDDWESMLSVDAAPAPVAEVVMDVAPPAAEAPAAAEFQMAAPAPSFEVAPPAADGASVAEFSFESTGAPAAPEPAPIEIAPPPVAAQEEAIVAEIELPVEEPVKAAPPPPPKPAPAPPKVVAPPPAPPKVVAPPPAAPPMPIASASAAAPAKPAPKEEELDLLGDLVSDLEDSLGDGFLAEQPKAEKPKAAAASASAKASAPAPVPAPVAPETVPAGFTSMGHELETTKPQIKEHEAAEVLSDLFDEFKEDTDEAVTQAEDPDTHYNLGIAFKEMGLLDEAIGELQKVCHAVDHGHPFTQAIQAYTWLAQCLVDKGVAQAAIRWYEKALKVKGINEDSRLAVYYDMGCAYEAAGDQKKAYETFMEVYSSNIDYRDVADRVKALKA